MLEIDCINEMLNRHFLCHGADALTMVEPADDKHQEQKVVIKNRVNEITQMSLYQFNKSNTTNSQLLPFFGSDDKSPKGLNQFCDFILLVQHATRGLYVLFIELKRGSHDHVKLQLDRSQDLFSYIIHSADRIKGINGWKDVDFENNVSFRKIMIMEEASNKRITKPKEVIISDPDAMQTCRCSNEFHPAPYCT